MLEVSLSEDTSLNAVFSTIRRNLPTVSNAKGAFTIAHQGFAIPAQYLPSHRILRVRDQQIFWASYHLEHPFAIWRLLPRRVPDNQ
ncbi:MAG: hypothetical protein PHD39_03480 [Methylobacter tundripaludum]|nr:hypothetical protein [Methylobacter tundripaludum]